LPVEELEDESGDVDGDVELSDEEPLLPWLLDPPGDSEPPVADPGLTPKYE